jgi:hypothetical protein
MITGNLSSQGKLLTVAERSDFKSTSNYQDVMSFIDELKKSSPHVRVEKMGTTTEGRDIPLIVIADPMPEGTSAITHDGRIVIYIQADIHAGEVEGKEAALMFSRDILKDNKPAYLKDIVFLICPLFNPDGNELISPMNRTYQNGPVNGVGVRYNGQFLDLNRDAMKAESPEVRSAITNVFNRWDPSIFMDCHTTDGSYHVEPVTFTWMVNPAGDNTLIKYMRTRMMPEMSATLLGKYKTENCFYGEFNDMLKPETGWFYDASEPRYMVNYIGLRNRFGILNENYVYADFKSRVMGCYNLIRSLADYAAAHKPELLKLISEADARTINRGLNPAATDSFPVKFSVKPLPDEVTIKTYKAELVTDALGRRRFQKTDVQETVTVPYYIDYYPTASVRFPYAYLLSVTDPSVPDLLALHGIKMEKLAVASRLEVDRFAIGDLKCAPKLNQGHYMETLTGKFIRDTIDFPTGTIVVRTSQPLADVAAYLLEPQSNDGLLAWNFLDRYLVPQWGTGFNNYPVYKVGKTELKTEPFVPSKIPCR